MGAAPEGVRPNPPLLPTAHTLKDAAAALPRLLQWPQQNGISLGGQDKQDEERERSRGDRWLINNGGLGWHCDTTRPPSIVSGETKVQGAWYSGQR